MEVLYQVLDKVLQSLDPRFEQLKGSKFVWIFIQFQKSFQRLHKKIHCWYGTCIDRYKRSAGHWRRFNTKNCDVNCYVLSEGMKAMKPILPSDCKNPLRMLQFFASNSLHTAFQYLFVVIRIFLAIPITVVTVERSFSMQKLKKICMRPTEE